MDFSTWIYFRIWYLSYTFWAAFKRWNLCEGHTNLPADLYTFQAIYTPNVFDLLLTKISWKSNLNLSKNAIKMYTIIPNTKYSWQQYLRYDLNTHKKHTRNHRSIKWGGGQVNFMWWTSRPCKNLIYLWWSKY